MSAQPDPVLSQTASVDKRIVEPIANSKKIYVTGSRADIRVPMREISCSATHTKKGLEENIPITVYDTSGPYTDPDVSIDIRKGLEPFRSGWIEERQNTRQLLGPSSDYAAQRLNRCQIEIPALCSTGKTACC